MILKTKKDCDRIKDGRIQVKARLTPRERKKNL